jgi:hypothetical protein
MKPAYPLDVAESVAVVERRLQTYRHDDTSRSRIDLDRILSALPIILSFSDADALRAALS